MSGRLAADIDLEAWVRLKHVTGAAQSSHNRGNRSWASFRGDLGNPRTHSETLIRIQYNNTTSRLYYVPLENVMFNSLHLSFVCFISLYLLLWKCLFSIIDCIIDFLCVCVCAPIAYFYSLKCKKCGFYRVWPVEF